MPVRVALEGCRLDTSFRSDLIREFAEAPYAAYFWEMPPVTAASLERPFEFVLSDAGPLSAVSPDVNAFREYFGHDGDGDGIVTFENLGHDATLIVPCPISSTRDYVHLAKFVRHAPQSQVHALFRCVANEALSRVSDRPLWVSTSGTGVYWLHVRLDSHPKYYQYGPYKTTDDARRR